ncbi:hypothetical protein NPX13_g5239 [Xylaria arbuscula]|uniref:Uncharacterized protein n=1 Tax=Xylaria arbuscula TaxID=114810 RepID=A0A9W8NEW9_9PEZI|nr:hypothetical protein NPX13_g5239 [Xylaria arbuscula]
MPTTTTEHPTPAQVYELGTIYSTILRHVYTHPDFHYQEPPTPPFAKIDYDRTPQGLFFTAEFLQNTYLTYVLPFLPKGASRKCKEPGNPWAYADPNYQWEWTWDDEEGALKDRSGAVVEFPRLSASESEAHQGDLVGRNFFAKKLVLENATDFKVQLMIGGRPIDFGEDARAAVSKLD